MECMNKLRAMDILQSLWEIVRDNKCAMDELREDFELRRRPCCAIRKNAKQSIERINLAYGRFIRISEAYGFDEDYSVIPKTENLYMASVNLALFFGV